MKFTVILEIHPGCHFGVPDAKKTVIPARACSITGDTFFRATMTRVGYGDLSSYRDIKEAVSTKLSLGDIDASFHDNFVTLAFDAPSAAKAMELSGAAVDNFLQHLSLHTGNLFTHEVLVIEDEQNSLYHFPKPTVFMASVTLYNLDKLKIALDNAAKSALFSDRILIKGLQYYEHALFLYNLRGDVAELHSRHFSFIISAAFLSMWKAVSTIVGDPTNDKDYQSRYKRFGFTYEFFKNEIEFVRGIRNEEDVAHYRIEQDFKEVEANFSRVKNVAIKVIKAYIDYVSSSGCEIHK